MPNIIPFDPKLLAVALKQTAREAAPSAQFLRMDKTGTWVFGVEADEIGNDEKFLVNPQGFQHGWVCWSVKGSTKLGEQVAPITSELAETGPVPDGGRAWEFQLGMHLVGAEGSAHAGVNMVFRSSSVGGKRAVASLAGLMGMQMDSGSTKVPVVSLDSESYLHKDFGKIYVPIVEVDKWVEAPTATPVKAKPKAIAPPVKKKARR